MNLRQEKVGKSPDSLEGLIKDAVRHIEDLDFDPRVRLAYQTIWRQLLAYGRGQAFSKSLLKRFMVFKGVRGSEGSPFFDEGNRRSPTWQALIFLWRFEAGIDLSPNGEEKQKEIPEYFGKLLRDFENHCIKHRRNHKSSARNKKCHARMFLSFLSSRVGWKIDVLQPFHLAEFIQSYSYLEVRSLATLVSDLRMFLRYLWMAGVLGKDFSQALPKIRSQVDARIPQIWEGKELVRILAEVDRGSAVGKRDYAILLLACRLGLRSIDIRKLQLENLNWAQSRIELVQSKTGDPLLLPLTSDVGNAIIDYLENGRPKSCYREVFLRAAPPHQPITGASALTVIFNRYRKRAGLSAEKIATQGLHSLRHTLASQMLERNTPLETIASVLGHRSTESTRIYMKLDIVALRSASLDPDAIPTQEA
ncbi:MAG: tyrosine-type recombinase/integrase [Candidatus Omnitrophica bacterium]|nr:tyrosine-type recombinase/integrase [Candidatus Omnitrophota bacterium]